MASEDLLGNALDRTLLRRIFGFVWPYRGRLLVRGAAAGGRGAGDRAALPLEEGDRRAHRGRAARGPRRVGFLYLLALVGQYTAGFAQLYFTQVIGQLGMNDLRVRVHRHVMSLSASFFDQTPVGRLMTRMTNDIESLSEMFASGIVSLLGDVVRLTAILFAMFAIDWRLALFSMGSAPVLFAIAPYFRRWVRDAFRDIRVRLARMNAFLQEHISGMKVVQAFAREKKVAARLRRHQRRVPAGQLTRHRRRRGAVFDRRGGRLDRDRGLLWHGGSRIVAGTLTFGVWSRSSNTSPSSSRPSATCRQVHGHAASNGRRRTRLQLLDTKEPDAPVAAKTPARRRRRAPRLGPSPDPRGERRRDRGEIGFEQRGCMRRLGNRANHVLGDRQPHPVVRDVVG